MQQLLLWQYFDGGAVYWWEMSQSAETPLVMLISFSDDCFVGKWCCCADGVRRQVSCHFFHAYEGTVGPLGLVE